MDAESLKGITEVIRSVSTAFFPIVGVWLGWNLSTRTQRKQRKLDALEKRFAALREIKQVADNIPPDISASDLRDKLEKMPDFRSNLSNRFVRLLGLRNDLIPYLDLEFVKFIDKTFNPLHMIEIGNFALHENNYGKYANAAVELRKIVIQVETKLTDEYKKLSD